MAAPGNLQVSFSPITAGHGGTAVIDGSVLHVSGDSATNGATLDPARVYIHVTAPPASGTITVSGTPGSDFTLAQAQAGHVLYSNDTNTSVATDGFSVWARCNDASSASPLAPAFITTATANATGAEQAGLYFGAMLTGATSADIFRGHFNSMPQSTGAPFYVSTTEPDCVLLVCCVMSGGVIGSITPPTQTVTGLSFAGLSFSRLSQQIQPVHEPTWFGGHHSVYTMEVWWARAPTAVSGALTMTTQPLGTTGTVIIIDVTVFGGLANPAAPFDPNASNFPNLISTAPPWTAMTMTPSAPEYRTLPWVYELVAGNENAVSPMTAPGTMPRGYGIMKRVADDINNTYVWHSAGRGPADATAAITFTGPVPSNLAMDDVICERAAAPALVTSHQISLRWSDDRGHAWGSPVTQDIGEMGEYRTSLQWNRCGYARDRIWELSWSVAMPTALLGAWVDITEASS